MITYILSLLLQTSDIPEWHYKYLESISFDAEYSQNFSESEDTTKGFYDSNNDSITLFYSANTSVLIHELGHHMWNDFDFDKTKFGKAPYVSEYAETNKFEDFSETYRVYYEDRAKCFKAMSKCRVIRELSPLDDLRFQK